MSSSRTPDGAVPGGDERIGDLLAGVSRGSEEAWRTLVERYGRRIYAMARSRCRSHEAAEDITQSVFLTLAEKIGTDGYAERGRFEAWLFRVAMNRVRDEQRRRIRRAGTHGDEDAPPLEDLPAPAEAAPDGEEEQLERLREAIDLLSEADREIIELRHHAGLPFRTISEVLGEPVGTLLARHHRALGKIRRFLEADGPGGDGP